jgi:hypothetical protein
MESPPMGQVKLKKHMVVGEFDGLFADDDA